MRRLLEPVLVVMYAWKKRVRVPRVWVVLFRPDCLFCRCSVSFALPCFVVVDIVVIVILYSRL